MAEVVIPSRLRHYTDGSDRITIEAQNVRGLFAALDARFPGLAGELREIGAVAIDGEIVNDPLLEPVEPDSDVHVLPPVSGG